VCKSFIVQWHTRELYAHLLDPMESDTFVKTKCAIAGSGIDEEERRRTVV
jgi:hypothetical protein